MKFQTFAKEKRALLFCCLGLAALFFSCQRTDVFGDITPNTTRIIAEFTDAKTGTSVSHDFSTEPITINLTELRLDPRTVTNHDTKVKVIVNPALVAQYNTANGTSYTAAPASGFSLTASDYVLNAGQRAVTIRAVIRPSSFLTGSYAVGLAIAEMSDGEISTVAHDVIVFISIKNDYDGIYSVKGYSDIPGTGYTGNFTLPCSEELEVATSGSASVSINPAQPVFNASSFAYITNLLPDIVFDKATNKITAVNARSGSLGLVFPYDAAYNSRYDPVNKIIYLKYGVAPAGSGRYIIDTLFYCKPR